MTDLQWKTFINLRSRYKKELEDLSTDLPELREAQQCLANERQGTVYTIDTPVVYNSALDEVQREDEFRLILVADNPGRREQEAKNRRYLIGPSGKIAEGFFRKHPELNIDFRRNVLNLNKTPIHTPRTVELKELGRRGGSLVQDAIVHSQRLMAKLIHDFHLALGPIPLWIIGYSELSKSKLFYPFTEALNKLYEPNNPLRDTVLLLRHFSMNQFTIDLKARAVPGESIQETIYRAGKAHRERVFGW